jgi:uncharacterized protein
MEKKTVTPNPPAAATNDPALPPRIHVDITDDAMSARLTIDPAEPVTEELSTDLLMAALQESGVAFGIKKAFLNDIVRFWNIAKKHNEFENVAEGVLPQEGREGPFQCKVQHIDNSPDMETVRTSHYYWQAAEMLGTLQRISPGMVVAEKLIDEPPKPGSTVRGKPLVTDKMTGSGIELRDGIDYSPDRKQLVATMDGVLYYVNNTIGVLPLNFNGSVDCVIEKMTARFVAHPPGEGGAMPSEQELRDALAINKVTAGINDAAVVELAQRFVSEDFPREAVMVAEGIAPEKGENGVVEFLFNTATSLTPKVNADGSVDYKNVDIIIPVTKGRELARLRPPTKGTPGKTIFGEEVPCKEGVPAVLPAGPNTTPDSVNADVLIASIDGIVRYNGSHIEVCEGYIIKGDVDFSTGNIKYEKSVVVGGDLKTGFTIDCGGDLQIAGIIEDSTVNVGGHILCKHGFVGQGKGIVEAKGDINLGFILNQTVKSMKNVNVAKEAINSTIYSRQSIAVHGKPLSVAGGTLIARQSITLFTVGNQSGVRTSLEVGLDFSLLEELKKIENEEEELIVKHRKLADSLNKYRRLSTVRKSLSDDEETLYGKLKAAAATIDELLSRQQEQKKNILSKLHELENAFIKIEHGAMPGTLFKIGEQRHILKEEVIGPKTVRLIQQEISIL